MVKSKQVAPEAVEVPVVVCPNVIVYDTQEGNAVKVVTVKEARSPRYKPV